VVRFLCSARKELKNHEYHETTRISPKAGESPFTPPRLRATSGFTLVEIVIALGVAAFCLVAMLGLIPTGLKSVRNSVTDTAATEALAAVAADLRDIQPGSNASPNYNIALPTALGLTNSTNFFLTQAAALTTSNDLSAQFGVITTLSNSTTFLTTARIQIYWPAIAPVTNAQGTVETVISFNRD
jgi:uncharacterized protein (TIGR02598 family)